ncbi:sialidase family protein [Lonepinella sp. BR2882]|uniref:sialidase family protein n=1 Tax=Lonepinella sp. BR2882 TaxID=3095283 RepID=UPI003F6DF6C8
MGFLIQKKMFILDEKHQLFNNCHASTILSIQPSKLLVAFFAGNKEGDVDTAIWTVLQKDGVWQTPKKTIDEVGVAHWNPVLHQDPKTGYIWLFYKVGADVHSWTTRFILSKDQGDTWTKPTELVKGDISPRGPVKNKLIIADDGTWLAPSSIENDKYWDAFIDISKDNGITWMKQSIPLFHIDNKDSVKETLWEGLQNNTLWENDTSLIFKWDGVIQPSLWKSTPRNIHALMRSTRGYIYRSDSKDNGKIWSEAYATDLPNNNSGIDVVKLDTDLLVLAYNPISGNWGIRYPIALACSSDNGITWSVPFSLEDNVGEFSYPAIIYSEGIIHLTYTWNRKNIVYQQVIYQ